MIGAVAQAALVAVALASVVLLDYNMAGTNGDHLSCHRHLWYCRLGAFFLWGYALAFGGVFGFRHWRRLP